MLPILNRTSPVLLYEQVFDFYKNSIIKNKIPKHYKIPSVRKLAADLGVGTNTVKRAYEQLQEQGYVISRPKRGLFVADTSTFSITESGINKKDKKVQFHKKNALINVGHSTIHEDSFPLKEWRKVQQLALDHMLHQYDYDTSLAGLKEQLVKYLFYSRGVVAKKEQVIVTGGTNQILALLCMLFKDKYTTCIFEEPGFEQARAVFSVYNYTIDTIPVTADGLNINKLKAKKAQLVYVTPSHQYPTGAVMPAKNRLALLSWAKRNRAFIIEDDYECEFRHTSKPIPSLQSIDNDGRVIYIGTFSKVFLPSLRVAYMILPDPLLASFYPLRYLAYSVPYQIQRALAIFMEKGYWEKHLRKMQNIYKAKYLLIIRNIKRVFRKKAAIVNLQAGISILLEIRIHLAEEEIVKRAKSINVIMKGAGITYHNSESRPTFPRVLIGFGNLKDELIPDIISSLKKIWFPI